MSEWVDPVEEAFGFKYLDDDDVDEEEYKFDELHSADDESDDEKWKHIKWPEFNPETDMENVQFQLGLVFTDCKIFREAVREHSLQTGRELVFMRNEKYKIKVECSTLGCPWHMYASRLREDGNLQVRTYQPEHEFCTRVFDNKNVNTKWLCKKFMDRLKANPDMPIQAMKEALAAEYNWGASFMHLYRAKKMAFKVIEGTLREQYSRLWETRLSFLGTKDSCSHCGKQGHNVRTCHRHLDPKPKWVRKRVQKSATSSST